MIRKRQIVAVLGLFLVLALLITACGGGQKAAAPAAKTVFRFPLSAEPPTLDPAIMVDGVSITVAQNVFDGLVQFNEKSEVVGAIAKSWDISPDGKTYTFHLRDDVTFHNGRKVTAEDFKYSLNRALNPALKSTVAPLYLGDIVGAKDVIEGKATEASGIKVIDAKTLQITIDAPKAYFLAKLTYPTGFVVAKEEVEKGGDKWTETNLIGTGPFKLKQWVHNSKVILEANDKYFQGRPKVDSIEFSIVTSEATQMSMYENGELDMVYVPASDIKRVMSDPKLSKELTIVPHASIQYMALNANVFPPFKDVRVRQAFNYAINKDDLVKVVLQDAVVKAGGILPPGMPGYNPDQKGLPFDVDKAKKLLTEAGYPDGKGFPDLTIYIRAGNATYKKIGEYIQGQLLKNLGLKVQLQEQEWGKFLADVKKKTVVPAYLLAWGADYMDPQNFLSILFRDGSPNNRTGYNNPQVNELLDKADTTSDPATRMKLYQQAENIIVNEVPLVPLDYGRDNILMKPYVKGVVNTPMGPLPFHNVQIQK